MSITGHTPPLSYRARQAPDPEQAAPAGRTRSKRRARKAVSTVGGLLSGGYHALTGLPEGIVAGVQTARGTDREQIRSKLAKTYAISSTVIGGALGSMLLGPFGLAVGLTGGFVIGSLGNFFDSRSRNLDKLLDRFPQPTEQGADDHPTGHGAMAVTRAVMTGAVEGVKHGWIQGRVSGASSAAGVLDGAHFVLHDARGEIAAARAGSRGRGLGAARLLETAMGAVGGLAGAFINGPGGLVIGALESTKDPDTAGRPAISRPLLLFATNIGKALGPAAVGAAIGGPPGAALGTAIGLISGSLPSMVDGSFGFNPRLVTQVDEAVKQVHDEQDFKSNARVFYRAGKGGIVGAYCGIREGWKSGYKGGVEIVRHLTATPGNAVDQQ